MEENEYTNVLLLILSNIKLIFSLIQRGGGGQEINYGTDGGVGGDK